MYQTFLSRALVAVAVTGGAFLLGRVLAHSTEPAAPVVEECELPPTACVEDCRFRGGLPDAPALPAAEPEAEAPLFIAAAEKAEAARAIREEEVIVIPAPAPAAVAETVESTAVLALPETEVPAAGKECPAFMPYIDDTPAAVTRKGCLIEEFFGPGANAPSEEAETSKPKGMPSVSRYLDPNPAHVDTMEFRPTDALRGDFQPRQL